MKDTRKFVVVTGVTRGLGLALTEGLIAKGCRVAGCGRSAEKIAELKSRFGTDHDFETVDVSNDACVAAWAERLAKTHGAPDLLVNNAAVINANAPLWEVSEAEFSSVIDVNIKGVANVIRHFVPAMVRRNHGVIVNLSSGWGRSTSADVAPYCATKWAIEGLTQALAQELPSGMAAIPLNPGVIDTAMLRSCFGESAGDYPDPQKWAAKAVSFLLSISVRQNGQSLTVPS